MPITTLPNGLVLETPTENEAKIIYHELFENNAYLRNGITVDDGATVFDVGANVGGFSASLVQQHRDLRLFLFEPIPETFAILRRNAERLRGACQVVTIQAAVSSAPGPLRFRVDPSSSFVASAVTAVTEPEVKADLLTRTRALLEDAERAELLPPKLAQVLGRGLSHRATRPLLLAMARLRAIRPALTRQLKTREVECEATTLSAVMRKHALDSVDLVKIDVEGSEMEVLEGIADEDWPRLRQLVIEVHDVGGRLERIRTLLDARGFDVVVEQEEWATLRLLGLHNVYAIRP
jgi:FkbM family methyltransferase